MLFCILKSRDITLPTNGFSSSHVWMWELDHKESWAPKNWCFWTVVLEKTLESPLDCKEIKLVNSEYLLEGLMLKMKLQYFGHLMQRADSFEKTLMLGKIEGKTPGVGDGQGSLVCCSPLCCKDLDMTELLNWLSADPDQINTICYEVDIY